MAYSSICLYFALAVHLQLIYAFINIQSTLGFDRGCHFIMSATDPGLASTSFLYCSSFCPIFQTACRQRGRVMNQMCKRKNYGTGYKPRSGSGADLMKGQNKKHLHQYLIEASNADTHMYHRRQIRVHAEVWV